MNSNPQCPQCGGNTYKNGKTRRTRYQKYRCADKSCGKCFSDSPNKQGGQPEGDRPLTSREKYRRFKEKHGAEKLKKVWRRANEKKRGKSE